MAFLGRKHSQKTLKLMSEIAKKRWANPRFHRKNGKLAAVNGARTFRRLWSDSRYISKMKKAQKQNGYLVLKRLWKDPKFVETINNSHIQPSKPQVSLFKSLCRMGVNGLRLEYRVGKKRLDIAHIPTKLNIEVDAPYWHKEKEHSKRYSYLWRRGWHVVRIKLIRSGTVIPESAYERILRRVMN